MSLPLTTRFGADPLVDLEIANKRYVDNSSGGSGLTFARVVKSVDEIVNNSSTLQDDDELLFTPTVNKIYFIMLFLFNSSNSTADFKGLCSIPTGATSTRMFENGIWRELPTLQATESSTNIEQTNNVSTAVFTSASYQRLVMGATAGNFIWQWAQRTATVFDTKLLAGSTLIAWESV